MSSIELKRKESLNRQEAANWLAAFAIALAHGGQAQVNLGGTTVRLNVPEDVSTAFEVEIHGEELELDIELKWSTAPAESLVAGSLVAESSAA
jgi:amphi-Trp domain-containing protein